MYAIHSTTIYNNTKDGVPTNGSWKGKIPYEKNPYSLNSKPVVTTSDSLTNWIYENFWVAVFSGTFASLATIDFGGFLLELFGYTPNTFILFMLSIPVVSLAIYYPYKYATDGGENLIPPFNLFYDLGHYMGKTNGALGTIGIPNWVSSIIAGTLWVLVVNFVWNMLQQGFATTVPEYNFNINIPGESLANVLFKWIIFGAFLLGVSIAEYANSFAYVTNPVCKIFHC